MPRPSPQPTSNLVDLWSQLHDNPDVHDVLKAYGLGIPEQLDQNFFLPEPGSNNFFGRHPRLSQGIENAFLGVANMGAPGATVGENISNVARSVLSIPELRKEHMTSQLMAPFQAAGMIGQLQDLQAKQNLSKAQASEAHGKAMYYANGGRKPTPHFLNTDTGIITTNPNDPTQATPVTVDGKPAMPYHARTGGSSASERRLSGQSWVESNHFRQLNGLPPETEAQYNARSDEDARKHMINLLPPGYVAGSTKVDLSKEATLYRNKRAELLKKKDWISNPEYALDAANHSGSFEGYTTDIQSQIDALDKQFKNSSGGGLIAPDESNPEIGGSTDGFNPDDYEDVNQ